MVFCMTGPGVHTTETVGDSDDDFPTERRLPVASDLLDPDDAPTEPFCREDLERVIQTCKRASDRAIRVAKACGR